jgi:hypothetical protein
MRKSKEYDVIGLFYGQRTATRSGVLLINHIHEGLMILDVIGSSELAKDAFCLHPIVQNYEDVDVSWSDALKLAEEYRDRANAYLCRPENDHIKTISDISNLVGKMSKDCRDMLYADKIQNRKDFMLYHLNHKRANQLQAYFDLWINYLNSNEVLL